ncbi:sensor protein PhoQ [Klebsiella pneumoniae]|nr:sensor protein PhoQ [Klebsiella pneumoniae]
MGRGSRRASAGPFSTRGQRADTLRPGQGVGLSVAREIVEQYDGEIIAGESLLGGACMEVVFGRQQMEDKQS